MTEEDEERRRHERQKTEEFEEKAVWRQLLASPAGRRSLGKLLWDWGVFSSLPQQDRDRYEGRREAGLSLLNHLQSVDSDLVAELAKEVFRGRRI